MYTQTLTRLPCAHTHTHTHTHVTLTVGVYMHTRSFTFKHASTHTHTHTHTYTTLPMESKVTSQDRKMPLGISGIAELKSGRMFSSEKQSVMKLSRTSNYLFSEWQGGQKAKYFFTALSLTLVKSRSQTDRDIPTINPSACSIKQRRLVFILSVLPREQTVYIQVKAYSRSFWRTIHINNPVRGRTRCLHDKKKYNWFGNKWKQIPRAVKPSIFPNATGRMNLQKTIIVQHTPQPYEI